MSTRRFRLANSGQAEKCPKCENDIEFIVRSEQVAQDSCNIWIECVCGYDPTFDKVGHRFEDVWGGVANENIFSALSVWNDELR